MWFHAKIKYVVQDSLGKQKSYGEQFILENITYGGAETDLAKILEGRVTDYEYTLSKIEFGAVYEPFNKGDFYKVTIEEKDTDNRGKEKLIVRTHYVVAESVHEAEERTAAYIKSWVTNCTIVGAIKSKILGVWHPISQQWQDDFKQRMLLLAEEGRESADINQMEIKFEQNPNAAKDLQDVADKLGSKITVSEKKNGKTNSKTFKPTPAEPVEAD